MGLLSEISIPVEAVPEHGFVASDPLSQGQVAVSVMLSAIVPPLQSMVRFDQLAVISPSWVAAYVVRKHVLRKSCGIPGNRPLQSAGKLCKVAPEANAGANVRQAFGGDAATGEDRAECGDRFATGEPESKRGRTVFFRKRIKTGELHGYQISRFRNPGSEKALKDVLMLVRDITPVTPKYGLDIDVRHIGRLIASKSLMLAFVEKAFLCDGVISVQKLGESFSGKLDGCAVRARAGVVDGFAEKLFNGIHRRQGGGGRWKVGPTLINA
jgi:hypothetical protein